MRDRRAGDAVTASLTAALAVGARLREALVLAAAASSVVAHKLGTTGVATVAEVAAVLAGACHRDPSTFG